MQDIKYSKIGQCGHVVYYKTKGSYWANKNKNTQCIECKHKNHSQIMIGRKRVPFTDKWKKNLAIGHKKSEAWVESMNTPEYKEKHRQKMIRLIKENKSKVGYNPKACEVFDFLNHHLQWNGLHAHNGKEQSVNVFFLDYYEPSLNVAIEWDEKHHRKPSRYKGDWIKQKVVMDTIGCEFYRVDEVSRAVTKIDKLPSDRTQELQQIIDEYYGNNK
jgi:hypothetical protein